MKALIVPGKSRSLEFFSKGFRSLGHEADEWVADEAPTRHALEDYDIVVSYGDIGAFRADYDVELSAHLPGQLGIPLITYYDQDNEPKSEPMHSTCFLVTGDYDLGKRVTRKFIPKASMKDGSEVHRNEFIYLPRYADAARAVREILTTVKVNHYPKLANDLSQDSEYKALVKRKMEEEGSWSRPFQIFDNSETHEPAYVVTKPRMTIDRYGNTFRSDLVVGNPYLSDRDRPRFTAALDNLEARVKEWEKVLEKNLPVVDSYLASGKNEKAVKQSDVVYIVAPGPSLQYNGALLKTVNNGYRLGVNKAHMVLGKGHLDGYMAIDSRSPKEWFQSDCSDMDGYLGVHVNPDAHAGNFKQTHWFADVNLGHMDHMLKDRKDKLLLLDHGLSVLYSATDMAIRMKPKVVVFVGADGSFRNREVHPGESIEKWGFNDTMTMKDINGDEVTTNSLYATITTHLLGKIMFMLMYGVRVINATEAGLLQGDMHYKDRHFGIEQRKLKDVIQELNRGN